MAVDARPTGLTYDELLSRSAGHGEVNQALRKVLADELDAGRVTVDNGVYRIHREAWPADMLAAFRNLTLPASKA